MLKLKVLIEFFVLICNINYAFSDCTISMEAADKCGMKSMLFGNREATVPLNDGELDAFCAQVRKNGKCVWDFNEKCLTGKIQTGMKMALTNGKRFMDKRCDNPKDRQEFLTHIKCLSPKEKLEPFHVCADKHLVMLTKLRDMPKGDRVAALCCITHLSQDCLRNEFKKNCGEETTGYWDDSWDELAEDLMAFSCSTFDTIAKCDASFNPEAWSSIKAVMTSNDINALAIKHKFKSEAISAVELMKFLTE